MYEYPYMDIHLRVSIHANSYMYTHVRRSMCGEPLTADQNPPAQPPKMHPTAKLHKITAQNLKRNPRRSPRLP